MKTALGQKNNPDLRSRSDLLLFILALIDGGIATPYLLKSEAGLSPGATIPVLRKLEKEGAIRSLEIRARGKKEYRTTSAGKTRLRRGFRDLWSGPPPTDVEAVLRTVTLGIMTGMSRKEIRRFLSSAAEASQARVAPAKAPDPHWKDHSPFPMALSLHSWMRSVCNEKRLQAEARAFRAVLAKLRTPR